MAVKPVVLYPDPLLKKISKKIESINEYINNLINDLVDTMDAFDHSVGISAPQLGENVRIIVIDASKNKKCTKHHGRLTLINPEIKNKEGLIIFREGCMSVPDYTGNVNRAESVQVDYYDTNFEKKSLCAEDFEAVLLQHEIDHLDGILFLDRIISKRTDLFRRKKY